MATKVKIRKKDNHYRFWSTISDSWISNWMPKWKAIKFLSDRVMRKAESECEEIKAAFPHGYYGMDGKMIEDENGAERFQKLLNDRIG